MVSWRQEIEEAARERCVRDGGTYYDDREPPTIEIVRETPTEVVFLAHRYVYNFAQSGSDWADHYVLRGRARLDDGHAKEIVLEPHHVHMSEYQSNDYNTRDTVNEHLARLRESS